MIFYAIMSEEELSGLGALKNSTPAYFGWRRKSLL